MTDVLLLGYLGVWILTSIAIAMTALHFQDDREPAVHRTSLSIVAGAVWPVLIIALAEAAVFALLQGAVREDDHLLAEIV